MNQGYMFELQLDSQVVTLDNLGLEYLKWTMPAGSHLHLVCWVEQKDLLLSLLVNRRAYWWHHKLSLFLVLLLSQ